MNEHDQTSLSHLITNPFSNWHKLFLTVLILTSLCVPSGLKSNSKYKLNFILERHCEISLNNCCYPTSLWFSPTYCSHRAAGFVSDTSSHPHNRGLGIKLGLPRNGALTRLSPSRLPFNTPTLPFTSPPSSSREPPGQGVMGLPPSLLPEESRPTTKFYISRLHSQQDREWLILSPFIVSQLCTRHCVRYTPLGADRPRRSVEENTDS